MNYFYIMYLYILSMYYTFRNRLLLRLGYELINVQTKSAMPIIKRVNHLHYNYFVSGHCKYTKRGYKVSNPYSMDSAYWRINRGVKCQ